MVYYNLGHILVVLFFYFFSYENIELKKVFAEVWEFSNIATTKCKQTNSLATKPLYLVRLKQSALEIPVIIPH